MCAIRKEGKFEASRTRIALARYTGCSGIDGTIGKKVILREKKTNQKYRIRFLFERSRYRDFASYSTKIVFENLSKPLKLG